MNEQQKIIKSINQILKEIRGKHMTNKQKRFLAELREKVRKKKITPEQAKEEWITKYDVR